LLSSGAEVALAIAGSCTPLALFWLSPFFSRGMLTPTLLGAELLGKLSYEFTMSGGGINLADDVLFWAYCNLV